MITAKGLVFLFRTPIWRAVRNLGACVHLVEASGLVLVVREVEAKPAAPLFEGPLVLALEELHHACSQQSAISSQQSAVSG